MSQRRGKARVYSITTRGLRELKKLEDAYLILKKLGLES